MVIRNGYQIVGVQCFDCYLAVFTHCHALLWLDCRKLLNALLVPAATVVGVGTSPAPGYSHVCFLEASKDV